MEHRKKEGRQGSAKQIFGQLHNFYRKFQSLYSINNTNRQKILVVLGFPYTAGPII